MMTGISQMEKGKKSASLGPFPISMAAVQTAAIIASKTTDGPLQSAPTLVNPSTSTSALDNRSKFELPVQHQKNKTRQMMDQPLKLPGAPRICLPSPPKLASCRLQSTHMQKSMVTTNFNQKDTNDNSKDDMILRSGKWTVEEENYAIILIQLFEQGRVDEFEQINDEDKSDNNNEEEHPPKFKIKNGTTLRAYLSRKLFCSPMRISKKFAGKGIGKLVYMSQSPGTYQQHWPTLSSSSISNLNHTDGTSLRSAIHSDELNRLKQAESNFLRIAFPNNNRMNVCNKKTIPSKYMETKTSFTATPSPTNQGSTSTKSESEASRSGPLQMKPKIATGDSILSLVTTRYTPFLCRSPTKNVGNTVNSPLMTFPNQTLQLQNDQSCKMNISLVKPRHPSSVCSSIHKTTDFSSYDKSVGRAPMTIEGSLENLPKHPSPLMAAPQLLSPTQNKIRHENSVQTSWITNDLRRTVSGASAQLQNLECDQERQTGKKKSASKIENLKEAYFSSVLSSKHSVDTNDKSKNHMAISSLKVPSSVVQNNSVSHVSRTQESVTGLIQEPRIKQSVAKTEDGRNLAIECCKDNDKKLIETKSKSLKSNSCGTHESHKFESLATFDWSQMMDSPSKVKIDLPDFLLGFDKVSKDRLNSSSNQRSEKDAACDLHQCAEFSPAYYTSKSFDDFHRYLGKGLSPTISPPPKFPNLRNTAVGPTIPSIESNDKAPMSNLQMRPRNQQNMIPTSMSNNVTNSKACLSRPERSAENVLSEAYAEAIMSSCRQQTPQIQHAQGKIEGSGSNRYSIFEEKPVMTLNNESTNDLHKIVPNPDHTLLWKEDSISDFPVEGMTFEDFETLTSCPDTSTEPYSNFSNICATAGDQSDGSEISNSGGGGRLLLDNSDGIQVDESFQVKKRKLRPPLVQSERVRGRISFLP